MRRIALVVIILVAPLLLAKGGAFRSTKHGDPVNGPQKKADAPIGSCVQCHDGHLSHKPGERKQTGNARCLECHALPSESGVFPGLAEWQQATHATARNGRCADCHDPHGVKDKDGLVPHMLRDRQPEICLGCHDGARASDVRTELFLPYVHGKQTGSGKQLVACSACHNAHRAGALEGVARVEILHGAAGTQPSYNLRAANDLTPAVEYEVCLQCHSSYIKQRPGDSDLARLLNPNNPSFHPIAGEGRNRRIDPEAFVNGYGAESTITCSDCHARHGSMHAALLNKRAPVSADPQSMARTDLCFDCHAYRVYADAASDEATRRASRFEAHAYHVGAQRVPCFSCHDTHGSTRFPSLIVTRRSPGINSFIPTPNGGTCTPSCHGMKSYTVTYAR